MADCGCGFEARDQEQIKALVWLLAINGVMFLVEFAAGVLADSMALIADSLDMFADAAVYSVSLYAVGKSAIAKAHAASVAGVLQILLALFALGEVVRRIVSGSEPESFSIVSVGMVALVANITCLAIISRHREGEVHMRASWIFSTNDVIANVGVVVGGTLVYLLGNRWPDIIIGLIVGFVVLRGGIQIMKEASVAKLQGRTPVLPEQEIAPEQ